MTNQHEQSSVTGSRVVSQSEIKPGRWAASVTS